MIIPRTKVLLISPLPPPVGGISSWTQLVVEWARNNGLEFDVVNTAVIGSRKSYIYRKSYFAEIVRAFNIVTNLKNRLCSSRYSVVHLNTSCSTIGIFRDYLCALIVNYKKTKLVVHYRCNIEDQINGGIIQTIVFKKLARYASTNMVLNSSSMKFVENKAGCSAKNVANFVEEDFLLEKKPLISNTISGISFVGHVRREKGVFEIIETAKHFPEIQFRLAGPIANDVLSVALPDNVILLGVIERQDIMRLLDETDLFLFPTYTEGFANALMEAMARGLPIITTAVGANQEMIESKGGILVNTRNVEDIVNAIHEMGDKNKRMSMSKWNIEKVRNHYVAGVVLPELMEVYNKCL